MRKDFKLSFPVVKEPWNGQDCVIVMASPLPSIKAGENQHVTLFGLTLDGNSIQFEASMKELEDAPSATFTEVRDILAPAAMKTTANPFLVR